MPANDINNDTIAVEGRALYRQNLHFKSPTFGLYQDHIQANIAILPNDVADDFNEFCQKNWSACPLLYRSKDGEVAASSLANDSDIRTDLPAYRVYEKGEFVKIAPNLVEYEWNKMVTFYLGCSFSFDSKLIEKGILILGKSKQISMYTTNILCNPVNCFSTPMVVSLRLVSKQALEDTVNITKDFDFCHGAPIHIGRPEDIGIYDITKAMFGRDPEKLTGDDVPVFWACGVTSALAVNNAKLSQSFSHSPGGMFVTDVKTCDANKLVPSKTYPKAKVICLEEDMARYSVISENAWALLENIGENINNRINFPKVVLSLSKSQRIYFAVNTNPTDHEINSLIYILFVLLKLNKTLYIPFQQSSKVKHIMNALFEDYIKKGQLLDATDVGSGNATHQVIIGTVVGKEDLDSSVVTIKIGDDGVGKFKLTSTPHTGLALAIGLCISLSCPLHDRYHRNGIGFPSNWKFCDLADQKEISRICHEHGIRTSTDYPEIIKNYI